MEWETRTEMRHKRQSERRLGVYRPRIVVVNGNVCGMPRAAASPQPEAGWTSRRP